MIKLWTDHRPNNRKYITILEQTEKNIYFKASNGWILKTELYPEIRKDIKTLYLQGDEEIRSHKKMCVSTETLKEISEAIVEYNKIYKKVKTKAKPKKESKKEFYVAITEDGEVINDNDFNSLDEAIKIIEDNKYLSKTYIYKRVAEIEVGYKVTKL